MLFRFVTRYVGFLKYIWPLPLLFDGLLRFYLFFSNRRLFDAVDEVCMEVEQWPGISMHFHKYGGLQFDYKGHEIGHIRGNGLVDIIISKAISDRLIAEGKALPHHTFPGTGWLSFYIIKPEDAANAIYLFKTGYAFLASRKG